MTTFMNFLNGYNNGGSTNQGVTNEKKASAKQIKFYLDLCNQRNKEADSGYKDWTFTQMSNEIQELLKFKPISRKQVSTIIEKVKNVTELTSNMKFTDEQLEKINQNTDVTSKILYMIITKDTNIFNVINMLEGGLNGSGSILIGGLIEIEKLYSDMQPPTGKQIEMMIAMYLCPDVDFEKYDISRTITLEDNLWRKMTPDEFKEELASKLTKEKASTLLNEFQGAFYEWKKTRIRPEQMKYIKSLEKQMSTVYKNDIVEYSATLEGDIVENKIEVENVKGTNYIPLEDEQLIMFSIQEASEFIDQLKAELNRREGSTLTEEYIDPNELRYANSIEEAVNIEYEEFTKLMYKLQSIAGYEDEELIEVANINLVADNSVEANKENRKKIREFMQDLLENEAISFYELLELTKESITAQRILIDM